MTKRRTGLMLGLLGLLAASGLASAGGASGPTLKTVWPEFTLDPVCDPYIQNGSLHLGSRADPRTSARMKAIFDVDQADRQGDIDWAKVQPRDLARQREVLELLGAGKLVTGDELFWAAFVFQHGNCSNHYLLAHTLAGQAMKLGNPQANWIYAATLDRWLMSRQEPQKYGTQYIGDAEGCHFQLYAFDPKTTNAERALYGVPPLSVIKAQADKFAQPSCKK